MLEWETKQILCAKLNDWIWLSLAATSGKWTDHILNELRWAICIHKHMVAIGASTYPSRSGCTTRSTSSQRRRRRLTGRGGRGPPPAARSNSPWSHTGRRPPLPCSPPTNQPECKWLVAPPGNEQTHVQVEWWRQIWLPWMRLRWERF